MLLVATQMTERKNLTDIENRQASFATAIEVLKHLNIAEVDESPQCGWKSCPCC